MPGPRDASWSEIPQRNPTSIRKVELRNCFACNCCNCSCICFLCAWNLIASCLPVVDWQYRVRRRELEKLWQKFSFDKWCCCFRAKSSRHVLKLFESQTPRTKNGCNYAIYALVLFRLFRSSLSSTPFCPELCVSLLGFHDFTRIKSVFARTNLCQFQRSKDASRPSHCNWGPNLTNLQHKLPLCE